MMTFSQRLLQTTETAQQIAKHNHPFIVSFMRALAAARRSLSTAITSKTVLLFWEFGKCVDRCQPFHHKEYIADCWPLTSLD
jgi:hypothetical protein